MTTLNGFLTISRAGLRWESPVLSSDGPLDYFGVPSRPGTTRGSPKAITRKEAAAASFLLKVPSTDMWREKQRALELNNAGDYEEVVRSFVQNFPAAEPTSTNEFINSARLVTPRYAHPRVRHIHRFQVLILLSYCNVLLARGAPYNEVEPIIQNIGNRESDRRRLLRSAKWINGIIADLVRNKWSIYRATELFFFASLSITYLLDIKGDKTKRSILNHHSQAEFVDYDYKDCLEPHYTIPGLIASLLDTCGRKANKLSVRAISEALGYGNLELPTAIDNVFTVSSSSDARLTALLQALGPDGIRQDMLFRGVSPQKRWGGDGNMQEVKLQSCGLNQQVANLFSCRTELEQSIKSCIEAELVCQSLSADGMLVYSTNSVSTNNKSTDVWILDSEELHLLGLIFTTYIYPRDQILDSSFQQTGRILLPYLERIWRYVLAAPHLILKTHVRNDWIEATLAAYKLSGVFLDNSVDLALAKLQAPGLPQNSSFFLPPTTGNALFEPHGHSISTPPDSYPPHIPSTASYSQPQGKYRQHIDHQKHSRIPLAKKTQWTSKDKGGARKMQKLYSLPQVFMRHDSTWEQARASSSASHVPLFPNPGYLPLPTYQPSIGNYEPAVSSITGYFSEWEHFN